MSLNAAEIAATRHELSVNLARIGVPADVLGRALGPSEDRVHRALGLIEPVNSVDVWAVRDLLVLVAEQQGVSLLPFSALTEAIRPLAQSWFPLRQITQEFAKEATA